MYLRKKIKTIIKYLEDFIGTDLSYILNGSKWWFIGRFIAFLSSLLVMMFFGFFISKEDYGTYQYIISIAGIISIFCLPGIDNALTISVARGKEKLIIPAFKEKVKHSMFGSFILIIVAFYYLLNSNLTISISLFILSLSLPFFNSFHLYSNFWQGKKRFDIQSKYISLQNIISAIIIVITIYFTRRVELIIFSYFFSYSLIDGIFYFLTIKNINKEEKEEGEEKEEEKMISFGKHLSLINVISIISSYIDKLVIWFFLGPVNLAVYSFAEKPILKIKEMFPISTLALPKLSKMEMIDIKKNILDKFLKIFIFSTIISIIYISLTPLFFKLLFPSYLEAVIYSQVLSLILIISPFSIFSISFVAKMKKQELYKLNTIIPIIKIFLIILLIPFWGIWGLIFSVILSEFLKGFLSLYLFKKL